MKIIDIIILVTLCGILFFILKVNDLKFTEQVIDLNKNLNNIYIYNDCLQYSGSYYCIGDNIGKND